MSRESISEEVAYNLFTTLTRSKVIKAEPIDPSRIKDNFKLAVRRSEPLELIVFWGGARQSRQKKAGESELKALETIARLRETIHEHGLTTRLRLLFMDTYSRHVNKRPEGDIVAYRRSLQRLASRFNFTLTSSSEHHASPFLEDASTPVQRKSRNAANELFDKIMADENTRGGITTVSWRAQYARIFETLCRNARL